MHPWHEAVKKDTWVDALKPVIMIGAVEMMDKDSAVRKAQGMLGKLQEHCRIINRMDVFDEVIQIAHHTNHLAQIRGYNTPAELIDAKMQLRALFVQDAKAWKMVAHFLR